MQRFPRNLLKPVHDPITVNRLEGTNFQDQHVERALEELGVPWRSGLPRHSRYEHTAAYLECQGVCGGVFTWNSGRHRNKRS